MNKTGFYFFAVMMFLVAIVGSLGFDLYSKYGGWYTPTQEDIDIYIAIGVVSLCIGFVLSDKSSKYENIFMSICPKCKKEYYYKNLKNGFCPKCKVKTIELGRYYKKLRKKEIKLNKRAKNKNIQKDNEKSNPNQKIDIDKINFKNIKLSNKFDK